MPDIDIEEENKFPKVALCKIVRIPLIVSIETHTISGDLNWRGK